jgi:penicillin amidase
MPGASAMKKVIIPALFFSLWMAFLTTDIPVNGKFLPAPGRFMNPFHGVWQNVQNTESIPSLKGIVEQEVRISFDERDIPHIYAANIQDALYAQGYLHAANRLFAMDVSTRAAAGRLSELIGQRTLLLDQKAREKGFEFSAIKKSDAWEKDPESKILMDAYIAGVNAYVHSLEYKDWPIEYKLLSHAPAEWSMAQSALTVTNMAIALCLRENDLNYSYARTALSPFEFDYLFSEYNPKESPVIPKEMNWAFSPTRIPFESDVLTPITTGDPEDSRKKPLNGSNNWAVSGAKTANGHPILANDPHLNLTLPNIWYEMEIHTPEISVHGVSLPGTPFIVLGFNEHIAWGFTNSGQDVLDWYKISWEDSTRQKYLYDGAYIKAQLRPEKIDIRGATTIMDTIRYTHFGPVSHLDGYRDLAMKWIGHEQSDTKDAITFLKIDQAKNQQEFSEAIKTFIYPAQNMAFASTSGDISLTVAGKIPIRPEGQGEFIVNGDQLKNDWQGWIPQAHAPFVLNPKRGFVSSANQAPADSTYPYPLLGNRVFEDYRGRIINQVLDSLPSITIDDMKDLQQNNFSLLASEILPVLLEAVDSSSCLTEKELQIADLLSKWNFEYHQDSVSPVYFDLLFEAFEQLTWDELLNAGVMLPEEWRLIEIATNDPTNKYFDVIGTADVHENLQDIVCASFAKMTRDYHNLIGNSGKNWGNYKASSIPHLARLSHFGIDSLHTSGGRQIVNTMQASHGPSWRMIVELTSPPKAWVNYPGGQSGNPASKHFKDMMHSFFEGQYYPVSLRKTPTSWKPVRTITIHP